MTFLLIYLIGVFIAMILVARYVIKEFNAVTIADVFIWLTTSLLSWFIVLCEIGDSINWSKVIWRKKE